MLLKSSVGVKVNCELREFAKSDGMPVYTIVGEVLLDNLDQLILPIISAIYTGTINLA